MYHENVKVAVVFTFGYSLDTWNSSGTLEKELKPYLLLNKLYNIEFTFITFGDKTDRHINTGTSNINVIPVYEMINKSKYKFVNYMKSFFVPFMVKSQLSDINIIKQNQLLGSWVSIILQRLLRKPLIVRTGYDMYEFSILENKKWHIKKLYKLLTYMSLKSSDLYTVSSKCDKDFLQKNFNGGNILIRPNWVNKYPSVKFNSRARKKIITVGRLENQKNFKSLIESFQSSTFEIDIIGDGSQKNLLQSIASEYNVKVNFLSNIQNDEIIALLKKYKYFISTSLFEGNPKSMLEALSVGCIVFASNIKNHREIIKNGVNGFLFELDNNNLRKVFEENHEHDLIEEISHNAQKIINKSNSIDKLVETENSDFLSLL